MSKYESYDDWYDNGPGSERFKREMQKSKNAFLSEYYIIFKRRKHDTKASDDKVE